MLESEAGTSQNVIDTVAELEVDTSKKTCQISSVNPNQRSRQQPIQPVPSRQIQTSRLSDSSENESTTTQELSQADEYKRVLQENSALRWEIAKLRKQEKVKFRKQIINGSQSRTLRRLKAENFGLLDDAEKLQQENKGLREEITKLITSHNREYEELQEAEEDQKCILIEANEKLRQETRGYRKQYKRCRKQSEEMEKENIIIVREVQRLTKELERYRKKLKKLKALWLREREKQKKREKERGRKTAPAQSRNDSMSLSSGKTGCSQKKCSLALLSLLSKRRPNWKEEEQWRSGPLEQKPEDVISYESEPLSSDREKIEEKAQYVQSYETSRVEENERQATSRLYDQDCEAGWYGDQFDMEGRKVIVRNIPSGEKCRLEAKLRKTFERYGEIVEAFVIRNSKVHDDDECDNFGFVTFTEASSAGRAIDAAYEGCLGPLEVERARPRKNYSYRQSSIPSLSNLRVARRGQRYDSIF